ncbi:MAG: type IV pilus modification protein PilV [Halothiobacillaceae bacterium]
MAERPYFPSRATPPSGHRGVTLIEVLIAIVVLSIGLLGMAALQSSAVSMNHSAYLRSQATNLAYDMTDRMRANRQAALAGDYDVAYGDMVTSDGSVATEDLEEWLDALEITLPGGQGAIERDDDTFTISVRWNDSRRTVDEDELTEFRTVTEL